MTHQVLNEVELNEINMETEWPLPVKAINTLIDSHSIQKIQDLGGIETIAVALRTNLKEGLPAEEEQNNFERRYSWYPFQPINLAINEPFLILPSLCYYTAKFFKHISLS